MRFGRRYLWHRTDCYSSVHNFAQARLIVRQSVYLPAIFASFGKTVMFAWAETLLHLDVRLRCAVARVLGCLRQ